MIKVGKILAIVISMTILSCGSSDTVNQDTVKQSQKYYQPIEDKYKVITIPIIQADRDIYYRALDDKYKVIIIPIVQ